MTRPARSTGQGWRLALTAVALAWLAAAPAAGEVYRYRDADGRWHFTDRPPAGAGSGDVSGQAGAGPPSGGTPGKDLAARLEERFNPATGLERATLAAVSIKAELGQGAGFFVNRDGYILTNRHVVRPDEPEPMSKRRREIEQAERRLAAEEHLYTKASVEQARRQLREARRDLEWKSAAAGVQSSFRILLKDGESLNARLIRVSSKHDLALLKLEGWRTPSLESASEGPPGQGETVHAIGNPLGVSDSLTTGRVTSVGAELIVTDVQLLPGNSGGPLVNAQGEVLGVNFAKLTQGGNANYQGFGMAIPISVALGEFPELRRVPQDPGGDGSARTASPP